MSYECDHMRGCGSLRMPLYSTRQKKKKKRRRWYSELEASSLPPPITKEQKEGTFSEGRRERVEELANLSRLKFKGCLASR